MKKSSLTINKRLRLTLLLAAIALCSQSKAQQNVTFYHTYLLQQGEIITFTDSYVDNTQSLYMSDLLEPVAGNVKQFRFLGTTGYYCFQSYDVNPFVRGAKLGWNTPNPNNTYADWISDDIRNNNTVYNSHRFLSPTTPGSTQTANGANGYEYIYVMPVNDAKNGSPSLDGGNNVNLQSDDLSWFDSSHSGTYFGYGHIWLVGSNAFGFPSVWAWKGDRTFKGWTYDGSRDNFVPMTQSAKNFNKITIKTGQQLNTKETGFAFKFFASQGAWNGNGETYSTNAIEYGNSSWLQFAGITTDDSTPVDFIQLVTGGNIEGINKAETSRNEAEKNSALPFLPLNYDLCFTIDLRNVNVNDSHAQLPLKLNITNRPRLQENADISTHCEVNLSGALINTTTNPLWADDGVNNYTLADALRFQAGIAYADQMNTTYKCLKLNGTLTNKDMTYLKWLIDNAKIERIDLSNARLPELEIPSHFIDGDGKTKVTTVVLPHFLNKISAEAFAGCTSLQDVVFTGTETGGCEIGEGAFKNCTALTGESIVEILKTTTEVKEGVFEGCLQTEANYEISIPANISIIHDNAFKDCHINKVNVPAMYVAPTATHYSVDRVGSPYPAAHNLPLENNATINIEAEDFNQGTSGVAYLFNHNSNLNSYHHYRSDMEGAPVWKVVKPAGHDCQSPEEGKHLVIGDIEAGDWMNYTVNVAGDGGHYNMNFYVAKTGNDGAFSVYVDGEKKITHENIGGENDDCNVSQSLSNVLLSKGQHVIQFYCENKLNFDYFKVQRIDTDTSADSEDGGSTTGYTGTVPTVSATAFTAQPNHFEIGFAPVSEYADEAERLYYVHEYKKIAAWKALLTKDLYENNSTTVDNAKKFDVCNQEYADVRLHRSFGNSTNWETLVLPFDVLAGTEGTASSYDNPTTVNTVENKIKYAAIFIGTNGDYLRFLNVGTHNVKATEMSSEYGDAGYTIPAGTPFLIYLDKTKTLSTNATDGDYVTFLDVNLNGSQTVNSFQKDGYWFCGTFDAIVQHAVPEGGLWALSNDKLTHATRTAKFKGYRGWFQTAASAASAAELFPNNSASSPSGSSIEPTALSFDAFNGIDEGDVATGISSVDGTPIEVVDGVYTLTGVRVSKPHKGIYIVNGKKMVVK